MRLRADGELVLGTVIVSAPEYGVALLSTSGGSTRVNDMLLGLLPYSDASGSALLQQHIQDGSSVVCMRSEAHDRLAYILTGVNDVGSDMTNTLDGCAFYSINDFTTNNTTIFDTIINGLKDFAGALFKNHTNSVDKDVLPGDVDVVNNNGPAGLHIGRYIAQLKGSPMAFIDVSAIQDKIRLVATQIEKHTITSFSRTGDDVSVDDMAADAAEAFGLPFGSDVEDDWNNVEQYAVPFFRMQNAKGPAVDGEEKTIVSFPQDADMHTDFTEPPVLFRDRTALSGEHSVASADGISSIKTPYIKSVLQFGYTRVNPRTTNDEPKKLDLLTPFERDKEEAEEEPTERDISREIMDAAINRVVDTLLTKDYLPMLLQRMAEAGLTVSEKTLGDQFKDHTTTGPVTTSNYDPPKFITLVDPITGKSHIYFDSSSFITQEPDGSILLCDGYGSEIRMSQGHIIISPALDLVFRPGRDLWALVPHHLSFDAQGYITVNSNSSVYLRAVENMQLAAATSGTGKLTLECDDTHASDKTGLIIRSLGNATFTGHDLYIGVNRGDSTTKNKVEDPSRPGAIIIDAGSYGAILEKSHNHQIDTQIFTALVDIGQFRSALTISSNSIGLYAQTVIAPVSLNMCTLDGTQKISVIRDGEEREITLTVSDDPQFKMKNAFITAKGDIKIASNFISLGTVLARTVQFVEGGPIIPRRDTFTPIDVKNTKINSNLTKLTGSAHIKTLVNTIYQDAYISGNCFRFPEEYGVNPTIIVPGMVWQETTRTLGENLANLAWEEIPIADPDGKTFTACYPGWKVWEQGSISVAGYKTEPLKSGYITNTSINKENKNA